MTCIMFFWENFGPTHVDRCDAVARAMPRKSIVGIELNPASTTYAWTPETGQHFTKRTLRDGKSHWGALRTAFELVRASVNAGAKHVFLCHYNEPSVQIAAMLMRLMRKRVYLLLDSKFDDRPRSIWREALKAAWIWPYVGAIVGSRRSRQYLSFLGLSNARIENYYDTISVERIRRAAGVPPAPDGVDFHDRHFTIVSRLVAKKNLFVAVDAFALYVSRTNHPRRLRIFGDGGLDQELRDHVRELNLTEFVTFEGFQQADAVSQALGSTLVLIQSSSEEQFGFAIVEALAMGVPVIVSDNCGARDEFVRSGVNGFVIQSDNVEGIAFFLGRLASDQLLWERLSAGTGAFAAEADAISFAHSVGRLTESV
ncbi:MAG: glycosyltransferase [Pseudomonadota bacterium]